MNILVINYEFPPIGGGGGTMSKDMVMQLAQMGHHIDVVTMWYKNLPHIEKHDGYTIHRVNCLRSKMQICYPWEQATYILSAIKYIKKSLDIARYDFCHVHFIVPSGVVAWYINKKYGLRYIVTAHGSDVEGHNNKRFKLMHKLIRPMWSKIVRNAVAVVSPSSNLLDLMKTNDPQGNYHLIPNGIELDFYRRIQDDFSKKKRILVMSRLNEAKGVQDVLKAYAELSLPDWKLQIVGDGPYKTELVELSKKLEIEDRVDFCGWVEHKGDSYKQYLGQASIYISGSRFENCPMSVIEAAAAGCQVILSDIPGHRNLMNDNCLYYSCSDIDRLSKLIVKSCSQTKYNRVVADDLKSFDWCSIIDRYLQLVNKSVISNK